MTEGLVPIWSKISCTLCLRQLQKCPHLETPKLPFIILGEMSAEVVGHGIRCTREVGSSDDYFQSFIALAQNEEE